MKIFSTVALRLTLALPALAVAAPADAAGAATCNGLRATIVGNAQANKITGTAHRDVIVAGAGNDTVVAGPGNDVICGGDGADRIYGGADNDILFGEGDAYWGDPFGQAHRVGDTLVPGAGNDKVDPGYDSRPTSPGVDPVPDTVSYADAPAPAVVDLRTNPAAVAADGNDVIGMAPGAGLRFIGTAHGDTIVGSDHDDVLSGLGGDDRIWGNGGDDRLGADATDAPGNDILDGGAGSDTLGSTLGYDTLKGGSGSDTIVSSSINKRFILGGAGADMVSMLVPSEPGFKVVGNGGQDKLRFVAYPNPALRPTLRVDQRSGRTSVSDLVPVTVTGKVQGFLEVVLPASTRSIYKGTSKGEVVEAHPDFGAVLKGRGGADVLTGSNRRDTLVGGKGFDIGFGKGGRDRCTKIERRHSC